MMATLEATWMDGLFDLLITADEDVVIEVIRANLGAPPAFPVSLVDSDVEPEEALALARNLYDVGQGAAARSVFTEVLRHAAGGRHMLAVDLPAPVIVAVAA